VAPFDSWIVGGWPQKVLGRRKLHKVRSPSDHCRQTSSEKAKWTVLELDWRNVSNSYPSDWSEAQRNLRKSKGRGGGATFRINHFGEGKALMPLCQINRT
jgi:hypothetical protein